MNPYLRLLLDKTLPEHSYTPNKIYYSEFRQIYSPDTFRSIAIKYVAEGTET